MQRLAWCPLQKPSGLNVKHLFCSGRASSPTTGPPREFGISLRSSSQALIDVKLFFWSFNFWGAISLRGTLRMALLFWGRGLC